MENNVPLLTTNQNTHPMLISKPWLRTLRVVWIILALLSVIVIIASIPGYVIQLEARTKLIESSAVSSVWIEILKFGIILASIAAASLSMVLAWLIFRQKPKERMPVYLSFFLVLCAVLSE